jgi:hypothetical protein
MAYERTVEGNKQPQTDVLLAISINGYAYFKQLPTNRLRMAQIAKSFPLFLTLCSIIYCIKCQSIL